MQLAISASYYLQKDRGSILIKVYNEKRFIFSTIFFFMNNTFAFLSFFCFVCTAEKLIRLGQRHSELINVKFD